MTHFHIRWSGAEAMDWQVFTTRDEAEASAKRTMRSDETYTIEELGVGCTRCQAGNTDRPR
jgi:hypothetical protein